MFVYLYRFFDKSKVIIDKTIITLKDMIHKTSETEKEA